MILDYGAQRAIRSWCIGTVRERNQCKSMPVCLPLYLSIYLCIYLPTYLPTDRSIDWS